MNTTIEDQIKLLHTLVEEAKPEISRITSLEMEFPEYSEQDSDLLYSYAQKLKETKITSKNSELPFKKDEQVGNWIIIGLLPERSHRGERLWLTHHFQDTKTLKHFTTAKLLRMKSP